MKRFFLIALLVLASSGCKKKLPATDRDKVEAAASKICDCLKIPHDDKGTKPLEECRAKAQKQFVEAAKAAGANEWGALSDKDYDDDSVEGMSRVGQLQSKCFSDVGNAIASANESHR